MQVRLTRLGVRLLAVLLIAASPLVAGIVVGDAPDSGNCFPFGCGYNGEYQQVYTAGLFSGPITVTGLQFFNTAYDFGATAMNSGTWTISLSTTQADWNTLSGNYSANIGPNSTQVFSGNLAQPWSFGQTLVIPFATPFTYDPTMGNLLMDVFASGTSASGGEIYFDANGWPNSNTIMGRVYNDGTVQSGYGLVTGFDTGSASIPEPGSIVLTGLGLAALAYIRKKTVR